MDLVGLREPLQLCLIESKLQEKLPGQISTFPHRLLYLVILMMMDVMEEMLLLPTNICMKMKSLMKHVLSIREDVMIMVSLVLLSLNVKIACHTSLALFLTSTISTK